MNHFVRVFSVVSLLSLAACSGGGGSSSDVPPSGGGVGGVWFGEADDGSGGVFPFVLDLKVSGGNVSGSINLETGTCDFDFDLAGSVDASGVCTATATEFVGAGVSLIFTVEVTSTGFLSGSADVVGGACDNQNFVLDAARPDGGAFTGEFWGNWESDTESGELSLTLTQSGSEVEGSASFTNASSCGLGTVVSAEVATDDVLYGTIGNNVTFRAVVTPQDFPYVPNGIVGGLTVTSGTCQTDPEAVEITLVRETGALTRAQGRAVRPEVDLIVSSEGAEPEVRRGVIRQRNKANLNKFPWPKR